MVRLPLSPAEIARGRRLGAVLRRARGHRSILDVAIAAQVSPETLRKIESGRVATPAFATVASVAMVLDLSLDQMWTEIASPSPPIGGELEQATRQALDVGVRR